MALMPLPRMPHDRFEARKARLPSKLALKTIARREEHRGIAGPARALVPLHPRPHDAADGVDHFEDRMPTAGAGIERRRFAALLESGPKA